MSHSGSKWVTRLRLAPAGCRHELAHQVLVFLPRGVHSKILPLQARSGLRGLLEARLGRNPSAGLVVDPVAFVRRLVTCPHGMELRIRGCRGPQRARDKLRRRGAISHPTEPDPGRYVGNHPLGREKPELASLLGRPQLLRQPFAEL